jgi:RNA polymerase sigma-32 factor
MVLRLAALSFPAGETTLAHYLEEIRQFPMLEAQEEFMLAKRWRQHSDRDAAHKLVTSHLRLAVKIAMGYRGYGLPISEMISEANVGLMQAVKRFEPDRGFRLTTYAMWWIKAAIQEYILRSVASEEWAPSTRRSCSSTCERPRQGISALEEGDLRPDQVKLIAKRLRRHRAGRGGQLNCRLRGDVSLDALIHEDERFRRMADWLVDEAASDQEARMAEDRQTNNRLRALDNALGIPEQARAAHLQTRRLADRPITLEDLAAEFGVSRERVRQIEARAFNKVQKAVKSAMAETEAW